MKISFLVTCHGGDDHVQLRNLLNTLKDYRERNIEDEIVVLDDYSPSDGLVSQLLLETVDPTNNIFVHQHSLNKDYAAHKNFGISKCNGDYILALDADELPHSVLLTNLRIILEVNPSVDLFHVPRINIVHGLTQEYINMYQWRVTPINGFENVPVINYPDFQSRLHRRKDNLRWERKLHEHIVGSNSTTQLPAIPELSLIHEKTLEKQLKQNLFYNTNFTPEDNVRTI